MKKIKLTIIILCILFVSDVASASSVNLTVEKSNIKTGELSTINVQLDTKLNSINTVEGDLVYDKNFLKVEKINIGSSFISFWVEKPNFVNEGRIHFSGIVPGGITIAQGDVFSVIFRGVNEGKTGITLENINLFLNDGEGTKDTVAVNNSSLNITQNTTQVEEQIIANDKTKPEKFTTERTRNIYIYDNKWYLVYSAQDKGTGINYYEVCEFSRQNCIKSESPHLLKYQTPFYRVIVRAVDADGNARESILLSKWLILVIVLLIVGLVFCILYIYRRYLRKYRV